MSNNFSKMKTPQVVEVLQQSLADNDDKAGMPALLELLGRFITTQERIADALESLQVNHGG